MAARELFAGAPQIGRPALGQVHVLTAIGFVLDPRRPSVPLRKRTGRPRALDEALVEAARHDLRRALDRKPNARLWQHKWAVAHVIDFLRRSGVDVDNKQAKTISRWIVQPVLVEARIARRK
jgi:hypothetical protein